MQCRTHPTKTAAVTCNHCANWICDDCTVELQGRLFCRPCLSVLSQPATGESRAAPPPYPRHASPKVSWGLLFFFSICFPPGVNYMYMGLIKRGLAALSGFFLLIFVAINSSFPLNLLLWLSLPVFVITSIFDGFNVRRRINAGEAVRDDIGDALNGIIGNKFLSTLVLAVIAIVFIINVMGFAIGFISSVLPWVFVGFIVLVIVRRNRPKPPTE